MNVKICFLVGTLGRGGAEKQLFYMLRALHQSGIGVRVICLTRGECYEEKIRNAGINVEWIGESENRIARLIKITRNLRDKPADVIQSSHFYTNIYAALAGKILGISSIGAIRSDLNSELNAHGFMGRWQISLPQFLIANSLISCRRVAERRIPETNIAFVRNVVKTIETQVPKHKDDDSATSFLWVGRLDANKKPERFIKLAHNLNRKFPNRAMEFFLVGDGARRGELMNLAADLELSEKKFKFLGDCSNMDKIYHRANILISTSDYEGTSNVILEAMAHGLTVIATNVGGTPDIVGDGRGILVEPNDETQLLTAAATLISNPYLQTQYGRNAQKYVEQNHSINHLGKRLIEIYANLLRSSQKINN